MDLSSLSEKPVHVGYKNCWTYKNKLKPFPPHVSRKRKKIRVIVRLEILGINNEDREYDGLSDRGDKHRCSLARVLEIWDPLTGQRYSCAHSDHDRSFHYVIGSFVKPIDFPFDPNLNKVCASGIHYYLTYKQALFHDFGYSHPIFVRKLKKLNLV